MPYRKRSAYAEMEAAETLVRTTIASRGYSVTALHLYQFVVDICHMQQLGASLTDLADGYFVSTATMRRLVRQAEELDLIIVEEQWSPQGATLASLYRTHPRLRKLLPQESRHPDMHLASRVMFQGDAGSKDAGDYLAVDKPASPKETPPPKPPIPAPIKPADKPVKLAAWLEASRESLHQDGLDADKILETASAFGLSQDVFDTIVATIRNNPDYWYPNAYLRAIEAGGPEKRMIDISDEDRSIFIREQTLLACERRRMPQETRLVLVYKKLERAGLDSYAMSDELNAWRKGRRIIRRN